MNRFSPPLGNLFVILQPEKFDERTDALIK